MDEYSEYENMQAEPEAIDFSSLTDAEIDGHIESAYKSALEIFASQYDGHIWRPTPERQPEVEQVSQEAPSMLYRGKAIPPLHWITAWLSTEREFVKIYRRDRANLQTISENDKKRVMEAVRRIKELEYLIKTYYPSDINGRK